MRYLFGNFALDTDRRELRRRSDLVHVAPPASELPNSPSATAVKHSTLIKTFPRKGFRFIGEVRVEGSFGKSVVGDIVPDVDGVASAYPERPSIAVLPFANTPGFRPCRLSGEGLAEDISTRLVKLRWLVVIARNVNFASGDGAIDARQVGRELHVRYVLEGSVRQADGQIGITGRLVDTLSGMHLWAERYNRKASSEGFAAADEIADAIASAAALTISRAERQRAMRTQPEHLGAWEAYQRGMWHMSRCDAAENHSAQLFFRLAIDLDPGLAPVYGALSWSHMMAASIFSEMPIREGCTLSKPLVRKAIALDEGDPEIRARLALLALLKGDIEGALQEAEQVLSVEEHSASAIGVKGAALVYSGRQDRGRVAIRQYLRLSPCDPARPIRLCQLAASWYLDGNYREAALTANQVTRRYPTHPMPYRWLAASLGQLGRKAEAKEVLQTMLTVSPSSLEMYVRQRSPTYCRIEYGPVMEGLRKAGWQD